MYLTYISISEKVGISTFFWFNQFQKILWDQLSTVNNAYAPLQWPSTVQFKTLKNRKIRHRKMQMSIYYFKQSQHTLCVPTSGEVLLGLPSDFVTSIASLLSVSSIISLTPAPIANPLSELLK